MDHEVAFARDIRLLFSDRDVGSMTPHSGELGIEIAPILDAGSADADSQVKSARCCAAPASSPVR